MVRGVRAGRQSGYTLIELLIVIAIIAIAIGLLLPAVQKVREASARLTCCNHLKQIGLGFHSHHDTLHVYPHGGTHSGSNSSALPTDRNEWSWGYHILPYIEQDNLFKNPDYTLIDSTPIKIYYCPSRRFPQTYNDLAKIDYAGNAGTNANDGLTDGVVVSGPIHRIRLADITDGASNTVLVAEKQLNKAMLGQSTDDNEAYTRPGWNGDFEVYRVGTIQPARDTYYPGVSSYSSRFGAAHSSGFSAVFCDGSVRHVRFNVNGLAWQMACTRNDGLATNPNQL